MAQLLINYTMPHSTPGGGAGAVTLSGVNERTVGRAALGPFRARCEAESFEVLEHSGSVGDKICMIEKAIRWAQAEGRPWVSVSLHFNQTPLIDCTGCRGKHHASAPCPHCGTPSPVRWVFGHTAFVWRSSEASQVLAGCVLNELEEIIPRSTRKKLIKVPDPTRPRDAWPNNVAWPRGVFRPAILVELGFACDKQFSDWIDDPAHQADYGRAAAEGVCEFYRQWRRTPLTDWHK